MARDLILSVCLLALAGYAWQETASYPVPIGESMVEGLGPAFFPRLVALVLTGLAVLVAVAAVVKRPVLAGGPPSAAPLRGYLRVAVLLALLALYWLLMPFLGYLVTTFAVLVVTMLFMAPPERWGQPATLALIAGSAAVTTAAVFFLFTRVVKVPLPMGTLLGY